MSDNDHNSITVPPSTSSDGGNGLGILFERAAPCRMSRLCYQFAAAEQQHLGTFNFTPRQGNLRETRQSVIATKLESESARSSSANAKIKPPCLKLGKYTYQPIATFRNAPKAYPAKPHVEGFSASPEKAVAAAAVVRNVQRNSYALMDATLGRDIFTNFWAETSVVDNDPSWGITGESPSAFRRRHQSLLDHLEDLVYLDASAVEVDRFRGGGDTVHTSRTNEYESDYGFEFEFETSRAEMSEFDYELESGRQFNRNHNSEFELPDPNYFTEFSNLLRGNRSRGQESRPLAEVRNSRGSNNADTLTPEQRAHFEAEFGQWELETSSQNGRGFIDLFSNFSGNESNETHGRPQMTSTGTDTANFESENEDEDRNAQIPRAGEASRDRSRRNDPLGFHARTRSQVLDRITVPQSDFFTRFMGAGDNNTNNTTSVLGNPSELGSYPRRQGDDNPRSFLSPQEPINTNLSNLGASDTDEEETSVFFQPRPISADLTPNSLFETFSEDLKSLAEEIESSAGAEPIPDEYFFQEENYYSDYLREKAENEDSPSKED